jgi:SAM-dependent methyltransferase
MTELEHAEHTWDTMDVVALRSVAWLSIPQIGADIWASFGAGDGPILETERLLAAQPPATGLHGAALVCGDMQSERAYFERGGPVRFSAVDGYDLSQVSLDRYVPDGIEWRPHKVDCNELQLPEQEFDLVVASHGAHHVRELANFFGQARRSLKPGRLLYMFEWIGPTYLQIPRRNRLVATVLLYALFPRRRTRRTHMGVVKGVRFIQESPDSFDPSEACNSLRLYPEYVANFEPIAEYRHGGLTYPMFEGTAQNMAVDQPRTQRRIAAVIAIEKFLTRKRLIHPLFVVAVGRRREVGA